MLKRPASANNTLTWNNTHTTPTTAQHLKRSMRMHMQVVVNKRMNETYVLYPCGLTAPSADEIPAGAKVFSVPLMNVAVSDTSIVAFLVRV